MSTMGSLIGEAQPADSFLIEIMLVMDGDCWAATRPPTGIDR